MSIFSDLVYYLLHINAPSKSSSGSLTEVIFIVDLRSWVQFQVGLIMSPDSNPREKRDCLLSVSAPADNQE